MVLLYGTTGLAAEGTQPVACISFPSASRCPADCMAQIRQDNTCEISETLLNTTQVRIALHLSDGRVTHTGDYCVVQHTPKRHNKTKQQINARYQSTMITVDWM